MCLGIHIELQVVWALASSVACSMVILRNFHAALAYESAGCLVGAKVVVRSVVPHTLALVFGTSGEQVPR